MKPTCDFEGVGEVFKLFFILALSINGLLDSGGGVLVRGEFNSTDCQIQKEDSIDNLLLVFKVFYAKMLMKTMFCKQHNKDLEDNPLAPTSMAYRSTSQSLKLIADFNGKYLLIS